MELSSAHLRYLLAIGQLSQGTGAVSSAQVARALQVSRPSVTRMLAILEEKGLVYKEGKHKSGYGGVIRLTQEGRQAAEQVCRRASRAVELAGRDLTDETRQVFYGALDSIIRNLRVLAEEGIPE